MIRTCVTAALLFKNHPNRGEIKFIIAPIIKEVLNLNNDLVYGNEKLREFLEKDKMFEGMNFDFTYSNFFYC